MNEIKKQTPCITITREYTTFGGSGRSVYRTPVREGIIPYAEMEALQSYAPSASSFHITKVTEDSVSFMVDKYYLYGEEDEIHTIPLVDGIAVFEIKGEKEGTIEGEDFTYEVTHKLTVRTELN